MSVTAPPRGPETEHDRDLERRVADLEALIREARRRARRRRIVLGALLVAAAAAVAGLAGIYGGGGSGAGATALAGDSGARDQSSGPVVPLAALPHGNEAMAFAFDARRPNVVYVASPDARGGVYVFKTTDSGKHWHSTGARGDLWKSDILSLTADPQHSGTLYAGTDTAVYKTVDGGVSWRPYKRGLFPAGSLRHYCVAVLGCPGWAHYGKPGTTSWNRNNGYVLDVAVDPADSRTVYSAAGAIRKSTNGGRTWTAVFGERRGEWSGITRIAIAPTQPESIYAIAHAQVPAGATAILKSTNAGRTWQTTGGSASNLPPSCCGDSEDDLAIDPADPQTLYAAVGSTVFATTDGGSTWHPAASGLPANAVTSLATDPRRPGTAYATVETSHRYKTKSGWGDRPTGGIYRTTDAGKTWTAILTGFGIEHLAVDPNRPSTIFAAGWTGGKYGAAHRKGCGAHPSCFWKYGLLKSTDSGQTWTIAR